MFHRRLFFLPLPTLLIAVLVVFLGVYGCFRNHFFPQRVSLASSLLSFYIFPTPKVFTPARNHWAGLASQTTFSYLDRSGTLLRVTPADHAWYDRYAYPKELGKFAYNALIDTRWIPLLTSRRDQEGHPMVYNSRRFSLRKYHAAQSFLCEDGVGSVVIDRTSRYDQPELENETLSTKIVCP